MGWCGRSKSLMGVGMYCFWWTKDLKWLKICDIVRLKYVVGKLTYWVFQPYVDKFGPKFLFFLNHIFQKVRPVLKFYVSNSNCSFLLKTGWSKYLSKKKYMLYVSLSITYFSLMISHDLGHLKSWVHQKQHIPTPLSDLLRPHHPIRN